jgi:hypothetical protein
MEFRAFIAHWSALCILMLSGTELAEVLGRFWYSVTEELHLDTAQRLS